MKLEEKVLAGLSELKYKLARSLCSLRFLVFLMIVHFVCTIYIKKNIPQEATYKALAAECF